MMIHRPARSASALVLAVLTITVLSFVAANVFSAVVLRYRTAHRSASWQEAALAAESGADLAVAEMRRVLPEVTTFPPDAWTGWTSSSGTLPPGKSIPAGLSLSFTPTPLVHAGEGNTMEEARVTLDAPAGLTAGGRQYFRLRSVGTTRVPGGGQVTGEKRDQRLRPLNLIFDSAGRRTTSPTASRTIELIVRPVLPFQQAVQSQGAVGFYNSDCIVDSFHSANAAMSTGGEYDAAKRQQNGSVSTNSAYFRNDGRIYGKVGTNGGDVAPSPGISGEINNRAYQALAPIPRPTWTSSRPAPPRVTGSLAVTGGTATAPARYKFDRVEGTLTIGAGGTGQTHAEIWITGDLEGSVVLEPGITATIYVEGNVVVRARDLDNRSHRAANLQIYGVTPPAGESRYFWVNLDRALYAAIYAPGHQVWLAGNGNVMGAIAGSEFAALGKASIHYDEALMLTAGKTLDYKVASWIEVLR